MEVWVAVLKEIMEDNQGIYLILQFSSRLQ